jgi:hypothetical protein
MRNDAEGAARRLLRVLLLWIGGLPFDPTIAPNTAFALIKVLHTS